MATATDRTNGAAWSGGPTCVPTPGLALNWATRQIIELPSLSPAVDPIPDGLQLQLTEGVPLWRVVVGSARDYGAIGVGP